MIDVVVGDLESGRAGELRMESQQWGAYIRFLAALANTQFSSEANLWSL